MNRTYSILFVLILLTAILDTYTAINQGYTEHFELNIIYLALPSTLTLILLKIIIVIGSYYGLSSTEKQQTTISYHWVILSVLLIFGQLIGAHSNISFMQQAEKAEQQYQEQGYTLEEARTEIISKAPNKEEKSKQYIKIVMNNALIPYLIGISSFMIWKKNNT